MGCKAWRTSCRCFCCCCCREDTRPIDVASRETAIIGHPVRRVRAMQTLRREDAPPGPVHSRSRFPAAHHLLLQELLYLLGPYAIPSPPSMPPPRLLTTQQLLWLYTIDNPVLLFRLLPALALWVPFIPSPADLPMHGSNNVYITG